MTDIARISTHITDGIGRLIEQYKSSPRLTALLSVLLNRTQDLEDVGFPLLSRLKLDELSGTQLDRFGSIVGQERRGNTDDVYRILIYSRIAINSCGGKIENVIYIFKLVSQALHVDFRELFPASIQLWSDGNIDDAFVEYIYALVDNVLGAGISIESMGVFDPDIPLTMAAEDGVIDMQHGMGSEDNPAIGGKLGSEYDIVTFYTPFELADIDNVIDAVRGLASDTNPSLGGRLGLEPT